MLKFLVNLFRKKSSLVPTEAAPSVKPKRRPEQRPRRTKHAWLSQAMNHVKGSGTYIVQLPSLTHSDFNLVREAVRARLYAKYGAGGYTTKSLREENAIEVTIK